MSLLSDISALLTDETVYTGQYPDNSKDEIVTISLVPGRPSQHVFGQQEAAFRQPTIKVQVRDKSYDNGYSRCEDIVAVLDGYSGSGITLYLESDIIDIGKDTKNRSEFYMLYRLIVIT